MKVAICDDREDDRGALKALLEAYGQDFEIREYGCGKSLCGDVATMIITICKCDFDCPF